jgi:hypothetical protein
LDAALKSEYAPGSPFISAREAGIGSTSFYRVRAGLGRGMNARQSGPGAVIKELAQADCEQEVTENGVVQAGEEQKAGHLIREEKEETPDQAKSDGQPIPEIDIDRRLKRSGILLFANGSRMHRIRVSQRIAQAVYGRLCQVHLFLDNLSALPVRW